MWNKLPEDEKNYLVCWISREDGQFSLPHKAYWLESEGHFFSLENNNAHPIYADIWHEMPELPKSSEE